VSVRGPFLDMADGAGAVPPGGSAHRIAPERVLNLLLALMAEEAGSSFRPVTVGTSA